VILVNVSIRAKSPSLLGFAKRSEPIMTGLSTSELSVEGELRPPPAPAGLSEPDAATDSTKPGMKARNGGIDALRAAVTLLVVFHHTAITYGAIGGWYYREIDPSTKSLSGIVLILFCTINQAWFMGLFFLLAGYYTPASYDRHGPAGFARERLLRLGVPLLVYFFLLSPLTIALAQTAKGHPFIGVFEYVWIHGKLEPGPLWFVEALLIFAGLWMAWRAIMKPRKTGAPPFPSNMALLAAALATGGAAFLIRLIWPVGVNVAFLQLGYFASYVVLFLAGCAAADGRRLEHIPDDQKRIWLRVAWVALPILPILAALAPHVSWLAGHGEGGWNAQALAYAFWEPFVAWGFIFGLLVYFQRRFAELKGVWPSLARRAYLIYIIHPPILVGTALAWRSVAAPALVKFVVTGSVACALCYLAAGLILRIPKAERIV
jgi:surface polysaccharide O-acyltransferase-like enzyme